VDNGVFEELMLDEYITAHSVPLDTQTVFSPSTDSHIFKPWSSYPFITRDISVWIPTEDDKVLLDTTIQLFAQECCSRPAYLVDTFSKEGRVSVAYRLVFQSFERTLTDEEVNKEMQKVENRIMSALPNAVIR
jgi:phenylalanyl-tRNA synthetase beta subunit